MLQNKIQTYKDIKLGSIQQNKIYNDYHLIKIRNSKIVTALSQTVETNEQVSRIIEEFKKDETVILGMENAYMRINIDWMGFVADDGLKKLPKYRVTEFMPQQNLCQPHGQRNCSALRTHTVFQGT